MQRTSVLIASIVLAACQGEATPSTSANEAADQQDRTMPPGPNETASPSLNQAEPAADECGADKLGRWLNLLPTSEVKDAISDAVGHDRIRYIEPGGVVTMDLRSDRLNVETGVDGRIKLFRCG